MLAILPCAVFAQNKNNMFNNPNKNPFTNKNFYGSVNVSMDYKFNTVNPYGESKPDTITTLGLNMRYDYFDFSGYIDIHDIFYIYNDKPYVFGEINNYLFGEINPRISLLAVAGQKLNGSNIFKDFLIAYNFTFDSDDLLQHYMGFGIDFNIPILSYLKINLYARYNQAYYGRNENSFDGFLLNIAYEVPVYAFSSGIEIIYSSWFKYIFAPSKSGNIENETDYSIQWKNIFKIGYKGFYLAYSYQHNTNYLELNTRSAQVGEHSIGLYYSYRF